MGELSQRRAQVLTTKLDADLATQFAIVAVRSPLLAEATRLLASHGLRTYDAVQLASALAARAADPSIVEFACFDGSLRSAAAGHGFRLVPVEPR